jgi:hypothetical protein
MRAPDRSATVRSTPVLIVGNHGLTSVALVAGLRLLGWPVIEAAAQEPGLVILLAAASDRPHVILVHEDGDGTAPGWPFPWLTDRQHLLTVGGLAAVESMGYAVDRGAVAAVNADQPIQVLVWDLARMRHPGGCRARARRGADRERAACVDRDRAQSPPAHLGQAWRLFASRRGRARRPLLPGPATASLGAAASSILMMTQGGPLACTNN